MLKGFLFLLDFYGLSTNKDEGGGQ